jgi:hypothetical protein
LHEPAACVRFVDTRGPRPRLARQQRLTKCAELLVGTSSLAQLAKHELDHDRIVEQPDPGDLVR